jgi:hypothetical protein
MPRRAGRFLPIVAAVAFAVIPAGATASSPAPLHFFAYGKTAYPAGSDANSITTTPLRTVWRVALGIPTAHGPGVGTATLFVFPATFGFPTRPGPGQAYAYIAFNLSDGSVLIWPEGNFVDTANLPSGPFTILQGFLQGVVGPTGDPPAGLCDDQTWWHRGVFEPGFSRCGSVSAVPVGKNGNTEFTVTPSS